MCVHVFLFGSGCKNEPADPEERRDMMAGRGSEMWPSQGHCTDIIFIDRSSVEGTRAETCTEVKVVPSSLTVNFAVIFVYSLMKEKCFKSA